MDVAVASGTFLVPAISITYARACQAGGIRGRSSVATHVEEVQPCAVHVYQELVRAWRRDGFWCIVRELEFGWVCVFCDDECFHFLNGSERLRICEAA